MTGSSDIRDSDMIDKIKIKSKEEGGWKGNQKVDKEIRKDSRPSSLTKENLFTPQLWKTPKT